MKRYAMVVLCVLNVVLVFGLLGAWFKPDGSLRNVHWTPPESVSVDYLGSVPVLPARNAIDMGRVVAMTDRPLFVPGRRPPPPPPCGWSPSPPWGRIGLALQRLDNR